MLESLEKMNMKRMSTEAPEKQEVLFDPEKDITDKDWERIEVDLGTYANLGPRMGHWDEVLPMIYYAQFFDKDLKPVIVFSPEEIKSKIQDQIDASKIKEKLELYAMVGKVYPELEIKPSEEFLNNAIADLAAVRDMRSFGLLASEAAVLEQIKPGSSTLKPEESERVYEMLQTNLNNKDYVNALEVWSNLKILDPKLDFTKYKLDKKGIAETFDVLRESPLRPSVFLEFAYNLQQFQSEIKPSLEVEQKSMPEGRNF